jgi:hypothetical protein
MIMPRFGCRCGYSIALHAVPCKHEATLVWDVDQEKLDRRRREQWTAALEAHARGEFHLWMQSFLGKSLPSRATSSTGVEQLVEALEDVEPRVDHVSRGVVHCPECGRLYVQSEHGKNEYVCYQLDSG